MKTFIVTPLYYVGEKLTKVLETKQDVTIIITDDVSPIFPLEYRMEWVTKTYLRKDIDFESIVHSDESEEFYEAVLSKVGLLCKEEYEIIFFLTEESHANLSAIPHEAFEFESPLSGKAIMDEIFWARFSDMFEWCIRDKAKDMIPTTEEAYLIPYFKDGEEFYFGLIQTYNPIDVSPFAMLTSYKPKVRELELATRLFAERAFDAEVVGKASLIGWLSNMNYWVIEIEKPVWVDLTAGELGVRSALSISADRFFMKKSMAKELGEPSLQWIADGISSLTEEKVVVVD